MRRLLPGLLLLLCACTPPAPDAASEPAALAACADAVARHVGRPVGAVRATWSGETAEGGLVTVSDSAGGAGERVHRCILGPDGTVRALEHTGS